MSNEFQQYISRIALERGLPAQSTPDDLTRHAYGELPRIIKEASRAQFRLLPAPEGSELTTIEVSMNVSHEEVALGSIGEEGIKPYKDYLRTMLAELLAGELMRSGWVDVKVEEGKAIATLVVGGPNG